MGERMTGKIPCDQNFCAPTSHFILQALDNAFNFRSQSILDAQVIRKYGLGERSIRNALKGKWSERAYVAATARLIDRVVETGLVGKKTDTGALLPALTIGSEIVKFFLNFDKLGNMIRATGAPRINAQQLEGIFRTYLPALAQLYADLILDQGERFLVTEPAWLKENGNAEFLKALHWRARRAHIAAPTGLRRTKSRLNRKDWLTREALATAVRQSKSEIDKWFDKGDRPDLAGIRRMAHYYAKPCQMDELQLQKGIVTHYVLHSLACNVAARLGWEKTQELGQALVRFGTIAAAVIKKSREGTNLAPTRPNPFLSEKTRHESYAQLIASTECPRWKEDLAYVRDYLEQIRVLQYVYPEEGIFPGWVKAIASLLYRGTRDEEFKDYDFIKRRLAKIRIDALPVKQQQAIELFYNLMLRCG